MSKKQLKKSFQTLIQVGRNFQAVEQEATTNTALEPGAYKFSYNPMSGERMFTQFNPTSDDILDLPSAEYNRVIKEMGHFLNPKTKAKFKDTGFIYKRSALLYGLPGTGKTAIVTRVIRDVINSGGICLFIEDPRTIKLAYEVIDDLQPDTTVLTVLEEIDGMIHRFTDEPLLSILDGEIQKENVMYLATTNFVGEIPKRILRPGRFSSVVEVNYPNSEARLTYFNHKLGNRVSNISEFVEKTSGLSIDELKEVVQSVYIFENSLDEVVDRIKFVKGMKSESNKSYPSNLILQQMMEDLQERLEEYEDANCEDDNS